MNECQSCRSRLQEILDRESELSSLDAVERLAPEQRAHLDGCSDCREELHELVSLHAELGELASPPIAMPDLRAGVLAALAAAPTARPVRSSDSGSGLLVLGLVLASLGYLAPSPAEWMAKDWMPALDPWLVDSLLMLAAALYAMSLTRKRALT